jgi:flagellar motor protein MotB
MEMAGKGGGAWKVAYADFATAMMAFFLVMWLISQDQKIKESIAHYFQGPVGINVLGESSRQKESGGLFFSEVHGLVPNQGHRTAGRSIDLLREYQKDENATMIVAEWLLEEPNQYQQWHQSAGNALAEAKKLPTVQDGASKVEDAARRLLARQMKEEMLSRTKSSVSDPVLLDLVETTMYQIDWEAIADECIERTRGP